MCDDARLPRVVRKDAETRSLPALSVRPSRDAVSDSVNSASVFSRLVNPNSVRLRPGLNSQTPLACRSVNAGSSVSAILLAIRS